MSWMGFEKKRLGGFVPDVIEYGHTPTTNINHTVTMLKDSKGRGGAQVSSTIMGMKVIHTTLM
jgi:hypothetical protein